MNMTENVRGPNWAAKKEKKSKRYCREYPRGMAELKMTRYISIPETTQRAAIPMTNWDANRRPRCGTRVGASMGARALLLAVLLAACVGVYVHKHWPGQSPSTITGASYVVDGDTIDIWGTRIRLIAIDAPELDQKCNDAEGRPWACGSVAARELRNHIGGRELKCEASRLDQYKRVLAVCFLPDGSDVNGWMVRQGWALAFRSTRRYRAEHEDAASAKRGLWAGTFAAPWEWRERNPRRAGDVGM
jgi:endonuclease YncB( thermonuclease family)